MTDPILTVLNNYYPNMPRAELQALARDLAAVTLADQLRSFVGRHFLDGSPRGFNMLRLADQIEAIEQGTPMVTDDRNASL